MLRLKLAQAIGVTGITLVAYGLILQVHLNIKLNNWIERKADTPYGRLLWRRRQVQQVQ
jgi:hypothetical protein